MTSATKLAGAIPTDLPLGMRMELARRHARLTQAEMAQALEVAPLSVTRWEREQRTPKAHVLMSWALVCGVDLGWLETGEVPDNAKTPPPDDDGGGASRVVRHQGLEPRTR